MLYSKKVAKFFCENKKLQIKDFSCCISRMQQQKTVVDNLACPSCGEKTLKLSSFSSIKGEVNMQFYCVHCETVGVVNSDGFSVDFCETQKIRKHSVLVGGKKL
jgi:late competence protein required for DNA uptake (superfamily II DNA/RNA helicase)